MAFDQEENFLEVDEELVEDLRQLIELRDEGALRTLLIDLHAADLAQLLEQLNEDERHYILSLLSDEVAGEVVLHLPEELRGEYLAELAPARISDLIDDMSTDDAADIVGELEEHVAHEVLSTLERSDSEATEEIRDLLQYEEETAGGRMTTDYVAVDTTATVAESIEKIREFVAENDLEIYELFVVDENWKLAGIVRLQDLVIHPANVAVASFMMTDIDTVAPTEDQAVVAQVMRRYDLVAVPVIDDAGTLLGIITFDDIADIIQDEASEDMLLLAGVTDDESLATPASGTIRRRLPWLVINLGTALLVALVVSLFQPTIKALPILAVLVPIVAGMGGNAAIQTITVIVRSMALGELAAGRTRRAMIKEATVGLLNGISMGLLTGVIVWVWDSNLALGALIALAMIANLFMAGVAGAIIPIALRKLKFDPALSSGPIVTTFTDLTGYTIFYGSATLTLSLLLRS